MSLIALGALARHVGPLETFLYSNSEVRQALQRHLARDLVGRLQRLSEDIKGHETAE